MIDMKAIYIIFLGVNIFGAIVLFYSIHNNKIETSSYNNFYVQSPAPLKFHDPIIAYQILSQLDIFEPVEDHYFNTLTKSKNHYHVPYLSLITDDEYCELHRAYIVDNPENIFIDKNFLLDYHPDNMVRSRVVPLIGKDLHEGLSGFMPQKEYKSRDTYIRLDVNMFFTNAGMFINQHLGKHFSCLTQISNHIPGNGVINRKDFLAEAVVIYAKKYETRPQCFNFDKFFPKTWVLYDKEQCISFFREFSSQEYQKLKEERRIVYIRKIGFGSHKAKGVEPVIGDEETNLRKLYESGNACGTVDTNYVIQSYVYNPLLLLNHKFDFRIYMLVASTNPTMLYYHDGFLRVSLQVYDQNSNDKGVLLTNTDLSMDIIKEASKGVLFHGMNETELRNFQMWNFTRLSNHLLKEGVIKDPNWLDNYLRPEFQKAMIHLVRMSEHAFLSRSSISELFGVDFMLDSNLNLWFIECNSGPVFKGTSDEKMSFLIKMLSDHFDIVFGLLKSRMKRIIHYVNRVTTNREFKWLEEGDIEIVGLEEKIKEFAAITQNRFEPEFEMDASNGFRKIIDANLQGVDVYAGLIDKECI